jgi:hypothetical protein
LTVGGCQFGWQFEVSVAVSSFSGEECFMRTILVASLVSFAIGLAADTQVIPLVDPGDPVVITDALIELDGARPVMVVSLENHSGSVVNTGEIWLSTLRFYTKGEMEQAGNRTVWDCGLVRRAADSEASQPIAPRARVPVRMPFPDTCQRREHEHFSIEVTRIGGSFAEASWKRAPEEFVRLLSAAQPHP